MRGPVWDVRKRTVLHNPQTGYGLHNDFLVRCHIYDVIIAGWQNILARTLITVRNSLLPQFITVAATCPGAAADAGEREKDKKHSDDVTHAGALFYPLVVESLGFWSAHSLEMLKIITKRAALHNNITVSQSVCNLHEQLSVCLWKNNARLILDRQSLEGSDTDCTC